MVTITQQKITLGLLEDEKQIKRQVSNAISLLKSQTDLMAQIAAYLFTNPDGIIDAEHIAKVTADFQEQLQPLMNDILPKLQAIESCGDSVNGSTNLANMISTYGLDPATFADRYK